MWRQLPIKRELQQAGCVLRLEAMAVMTYIVLDTPTNKFLTSLRSMRKQAGLSQKEVALAVKIAPPILHIYETGKRYPSLRNLMKLADYFGYDLSDSVNYKFYRGEIRPSETKERIQRQRLTYFQLALATGYSQKSVGQSVRQAPNGSLLCLNAVLECLANLERPFRDNGDDS